MQKQVDKLRLAARCVPGAESAVNKTGTVAALMNLHSRRERDSKYMNVICQVVTQRRSDPCGFLEKEYYRRKEKPVQMHRGGAEKGCLC